MRLSVPNWRPGDRIPRGRDTLEVVEVRYEQEETTLVVKPGVASRSGDAR
jgi:hypothetical protein